MLLPLYVWNMAFVVVSCAMSPWVFNTHLFWWALLPTSILVGASILAELVITGVRVRVVLWFFPVLRFYKYARSMCHTQLSSMSLDEVVVHGQSIFLLFMLRLKLHLSCEIEGFVVFF